MPASWANSAILWVPTSWARRTVGTFLDRTSASRSVISPSKRPSKFFGFQERRPPRPTSSGWSRTFWFSMRPEATAVAYTNGLNALPACRRADLTRSKRECTKSRPPTQARTSPVCASSATTAPCRYGVSPSSATWRAAA